MERLNYTTHAMADLVNYRDWQRSGPRRSERRRWLWKVSRPNGSGRARRSGRRRLKARCSRRMRPCFGHEGQHAKQVIEGR